ncbi:MAG: efflux transporter outer membrane subunit [Cellvibrionaceae bacterium]
MFLTSTPLLQFIGLFSLASVLINCGAAATKKNEIAVKEKIGEQTSLTAKNWSTQSNPSDITVDWLQSFNDTLLDRLVLEAQTNNRNLQAAAASVESAQALAKQAGVALQPNIGLSSDAARAGTGSGDIKPVDSRGLGLQVSWELDLWGRIRNNQQAAVNSVKAAQADFRYAQHSLAATTAQAYFALIEANVQIESALENVDIIEETARIVDVQYKNGMVSAQDLALSRSNTASAREQLISLKGAQRNAARALEVLLGRYPSAEIQAGNTLPDVPPAPPAGIPSELLERRPDMIAAERRVAAAFNKREVARTARLPSLSLTGALGGSSNALSSVLDPANTTWRLGANLVASLFDGGAAQAQVDAASAEQKQALFNYGQSALTAFNEVETGLDQGTVLQQRRDELSIVQQEADKAYRIASLRYKEGEISLLDLLSVQQRLISAKTNLISIERLLLEQRTSLYLALGGDW